MNRDEIINLFRDKLNVNTLYTRQFLDELLLTELNITINITALTYNRWNEGMNDTLCLFEHVGRAEYKFLDTEQVSNFTGIVSHFPQGEGREYLIGNFINGKMTYLNGASNFKEWRNSNDVGERIINEGTKFEASKENKDFKFYISDGNTTNFSDGYGPIGINSPLGIAFIGKKVGDIVIINNYSYSITKII
jgi:hypothetical protein